MATTIKLKNSVTTTNAPSSLVQGEVAINITDKKVWVGNAAGTPIQLLGAGGSASFGALTCTSLTNSGLTSGRVTYASTGGLLADSANLTFNGTTLTAAALTSTGVATFSAGTVSAPAITTTGDTNTGIFFPAADTIAFTEGGAESMRIDSSGNVGIGTSSPSQKLHVNGGVLVKNDSGFVWVDNAGGTGFPYITPLGYYVDGGYESRIYSTGVGNGQSMLFSTAATERMRIAANGNVGIGTSSPSYTLDVRASTALISATSTTGTNISYLASNNSGGFFGLGRDNSIGGLTGAAYSSFLYADGAYPMLFFTNSSERMRITSGGNVCIGTTTTPNQQAVIYRTSSTTSNGALLLDGNGSYAGVQFAVSGTLQGSISSDLAALYITHEDVITFNTGGSGNVGGTERMRITSAGYFKASNDGDYAPEGSTSTVHQFCQTSNSVALSVVCRNTGQSGDTVRIESYRNTTNNSFYFMGLYNRTANAFKLQIADSGNVTNTNGSYGTISDAKNKENIVDATPKLDKIKQLQVRNFNFKGDDLKQIGFVAQEFEQVFPSMVEEHHDKDADGNDLGTTTKSIKTSVLVPILVKAIQEQQAMIEELTNRIKKLEGV